MSDKEFSEAVKNNSETKVIEILEKNPGVINNYSFYCEELECYLTPLQIASYYGYANLITILIKYGAQLNLMTKTAYLTKNYAVKIVSFGIWNNCTEKTALHLAALKGHQEVINILCEHGADYRIVDNNKKIIPIKMLMEAFSKTVKLNVFKLKDYKLTRDEVQQIALMIKTNQALISLDLSGCVYQDYLVILEAIKESKNITQFALQLKFNCKFDFEAVLYGKPRLIDVLHSLEDVLKVKKDILYFDIGTLDYVYLEKKQVVDQRKTDEARWQAQRDSNTSYIISGGRSASLPAHTPTYYHDVEIPTSGRLLDLSSTAISLNINSLNSKVDLLYKEPSRNFSNDEIEIIREKLISINKLIENNQMQAQLKRMGLSKN